MADKIKMIVTSIKRKVAALTLYSAKVTWLGAGKRVKQA
jgi:hypothetical protein